MTPPSDREGLLPPRSHRRLALFLNGYQTLLLVMVAFLLAIVVPIVSPSLLGNFSTIAYTAISCALASSAAVYLLRGVRNYPGVEETLYAVPAFCVTYGLLIVILIMARIPYSRLLLASTFLFSVIVSLGIHTLLRRKIRRRIGVVPAGEFARLLDAPGVEWRLLNSPDTSIDGLDSISVDLWCDLSDAWERELASLALRGIPVYHSKHLLESLTGKVEIEQLSENNFGTLSPLYAYMTIKHVADWLAAALALVALFPLLLVIGLWIKFDSTGPAIFQQVRIGYRGKTFSVFKFRTMTVAANSGAGDSARDAAMTKSQDQRITRIGRFLRRSRLDELPQLVNVLKGEMSWIGPRPEAEVLSRWYENDIPFYRYRHIVRPGITGWAQVQQGHVVDVVQVREKLHFDFYYIKNFSLWIDVIVIARTVRTMLTGFGSR